MGELHPSIAALLKFFSYVHLPQALQEVSKPLCDCAIHLACTLPQNAELMTGLRKLLEAKDCFVRAALPSEEDAH